MASPEPRSSPYRWTMLTILWLLYFSFGMVARSPSPLVTPVLQELQMSYSQIGFVLGSWQMAYIVFAVMGGVIMDRWGIRKSIFAGALVIAASAFLRSLSVGFVSLLLFVALFGAGGPMISIGCPKTIALWFKGKERGMAVGIYTTGPWIGGMVALAITNSVVMPMTGYSWRWTFGFYGSVALVFALLWWALAREIETEVSPERLPVLKVLGALIKVHNVRLILLSGLMSFAVLHGFNNWLPKLLETHGMSPEHAGYAAAIPYVTSIPMVLILPRLIPRQIRGRWIGLLAVSAGASVIWVTIPELPPLIGLLLYGGTASCIFPLLVLELMETPEVGTRYLGASTGVFFCVSEIGGFFGPFVVGLLMDVTRTFMAGSGFLASLGGVIFILMACRKKDPRG